jgi:hypothetical protein
MNRFSIFFLPRNQQSEYSVLYELMCWLANYRDEVPSSEEISLVDSIIVDWFLAPRKWGFNLKSKSTNYPHHGHHGDPPPTRKIPMVEPGIELGTSWLVVRSSDHQTTRLVDPNTTTHHFRYIFDREVVLCISRGYSTFGSYKLDS